MLVSKLLEVAALWAVSLPLSAAVQQSQAAVTEYPDFHPEDYDKSFASCPAVERSGPTPQKINLRLAYLDINPDAEKTLILVHGWPSLWTTYRHQIQHFGQDYRLIVPEHRGYGDSQHPRDLNSSNTFQDFVNDIQCIMDKAKVRSGVCVGNDFGAQVCWEAGRLRPDRFIGVFNVGIPVSLISLSTPR
jgi:soluble epoxide hydrolase/lipid-phosphate phosphatase